MEGPAVECEESEDPGEFECKFAGELFGRDAAEEDSGGGPCEVSEGEEVDAGDPVREPFEWDHVSGEEVAEHHIDKDERADFEEPEGDESDPCFDEEADGEAHEEGGDESGGDVPVRPAGEP